MWRSQQLMEYAGCRVTENCLVIPDSRFFAYDSTQLLLFLSPLGDEGRVFYAITQLSLDMVFPIVYALFGVGLLIRFSSGPGNGVLALPFFAAVCDFVENTLLTLMALEKLPIEFFAFPAAVATEAKFGFIFATLLVLVFEMIKRLRFAQP